MNEVILMLGHSPDADDAFMWWPLTGKVHVRDRDKRGVAEPITAPILDTGRYRFLAVPADIEVLNRRAVEIGDLDITALSMHCYTHVKDRYVLTACGASMGDGYGPKIVCRKQDLAGDRPQASKRFLDSLAKGERSLAIPGRKTTAFLTTCLMLGPENLRTTEMMFDRVIPSVASGEVDAGLVIHDGQLTFVQAGLEQVIDLGAWWKEHTGGAALPLGANAARRDLDARFGSGTMKEVAGLLEQSVAYALEKRAESLAYVLPFAPGATADQVDRYISMYVTELTQHAGERGRAGIQRLLREGAAAGLCPDPGDVDLLEG